jgi:PAS domain S-box-containing protein
MNEKQANALAHSRRFLAQVASPANFDVLFDHLPHVYFFVKDAEGRFMRVNRAFLKLVNVNEEEDVIGASDRDFFPQSLAESYARDDREVIRSSEAIVDKAELVQNPDGSADWFCTTKLPVLDKDRRAIGVCGVTRDVSKMTANNARFLLWEPVLQTMLTDFASPLDAASLAQRVALSVSQFNRLFRKRFHTSPGNYLTQIRVTAACNLLATTQLTMSQIALKTGFYDQSHFTNQFVRYRGVPPSKYRAQLFPALKPLTRDPESPKQSG